MSPDIIIIGGGPAALTAGLYACRAGRSVTLLEKEAIGGQIADSPRVENFPSIKSISGLELANNMFEQFTELGGNFELDEIESIEKNESTFLVKGKYSAYESKAVIIATGVKHRHLNIKGEDEYIGHGISYCAVCDGAFYEGKDVTVIGDANSALQYALLLAKICSHVNVVTLFERFFADEILVNALRKEGNVTIYHNMNSKEFKGDGTALKSIVFEDTKTKQIKEIPAEAAFVAIGQVPDSDRFSNLVDLNKGFIVVDEDKKTKTDGLFAAGDCTDKKVRQLTTACGDGAIAALSANKYLFSLK